MSNDYEITNSGHMNGKRRRLFVFKYISEDDYYYSHAFALADSLDEAHELIGKQLADTPWLLDEIKRTAPAIIDVNQNYALFIGGG